MKHCIKVIAGDVFKSMEFDEKEFPENRKALRNMIRMDDPIGQTGSLELPTDRGFIYFPREVMEKAIVILETIE